MPEISTSGTVSDALRRYEQMLADQDRRHQVMAARLDILDRELAELRDMFNKLKKEKR